MPTEIKIGKTVLRLVTGDIAEQDTEAVVTIIEFLKKGDHDLNEVRMVLYQREDDRAYPVFVAALNQILAEQIGGVSP